MRLTRLIVGTVSAALLGLVPVGLVAAPAQAADLTTTSTLEASRNLIEFKGNYKPYLTGRVKASDGSSVYDGTVDLWAKPAGAKWRKVRSGVKASGFISFADVIPKRNTKYRLEYSGGASYGDTYQASKSKNLNIRVARKFTLKRTNNRRAYVYKGRVTPKYGKKKIVVQVSKRKKKGYKRFKTIRTNKKGFYTLRLPNRKGTWHWKVKAPGNKKYAVNGWDIKTW